MELHYLADKLIDIQHQRYNYETKFFEETKQKDDSIVNATILEIILILAISSFQIYMIKKYFDENNKPLFWIWLLCLISNSP